MNRRSRISVALAMALVIILLAALLMVDWERPRCDEGPVASQSNCAESP